MSQNMTYMYYADRCSHCKNIKWHSIGIASYYYVVCATPFLYYVSYEAY